jgi:cobalt-zinc-cadmium efflux system membrane fusion protein
MKRSLLKPLAGIVLLSACSHPAQQPNDAQSSVPLAPVHYRSITETITATGQVGSPAGTQTKLSFLVSGVLQQVYIHVGDRVVAGEALAQLDTSGLSLSARQAEAGAQAAAASAQQAGVDRTSTKIALDEAQVRREETLYQAGIAARKDTQAAQAQLAADRADAQSNTAQLRSANAQAQSAAAQASLAQRDLASGTLRSFSGGVVVAVFHRAGESVDPATPILAIGEPYENTITLDVAANDAVRVHPGEAVSINVIGSPLHGESHVAGVSSALDPTTQTATVVLTGVPAGALAGAAVQATIDVAVKRGLVIPQSAIVQDPQTGETLVFVQVRDSQGEKKFVQRTVHVAFNNGTDALISSGLHPGENIAAQGAFELLTPANGGT